MILPALPAGIVLDSANLPFAALVTVLQADHSERRRRFILGLQQASLQGIRVDIWRKGKQDAVAGQRAAHLQGLVASGEEEAAVVAVEEAAIRMDPKRAGDEGIVYGVMETMILIPADPADVEGLECGILEVAAAGVVAGAVDRIRHLEGGRAAEPARDVEAQEGRGLVALAIAGEELEVGDGAAPAPRGGRGVDEGGRRRDAEQDPGEDLKREGVDGGGGAARELRLRRRRRHPGEKGRGGHQ